MLWLPQVACYHPSHWEHRKYIGRTVTDQEGEVLAADASFARPPSLPIAARAAAACSRFPASHCAMPPPPQVLALGGAAAAVGIGYALHRAHERAASDAAKTDEARMNEELNRNRERSAEAKQVCRRSDGPVSNHHQV